MPPFIEGLKTLLNEVASWALYLTPGIIIIVTLIIGGIALSKAEDAVDTKAIKDRMQRVALGAALAGGGTWVGNYIWGLFI